jgi:LacI family transcriptional regulator
MRKVTIEDISRDTGLSRGTVSRALNDRPDISTRTKQRVLESCQKLNYVPSHAARSLATGRNYAVAVLIENLRSAFAASFLRGVIARAQQSHYAVHVVETGPNPPPEQMAAFSPERIDAALNAIPLDAARGDKLRRSMDNRVLTSCWPFEGATCDVLMPDQAEAGRLIARFLIRAGLREILYVNCPTCRGATERLNGFQEICRETGIDPEAATVMILATRLGRHPGDDLAVIGQGNENAAAEIRPTLTTIDFDGEGIGRRSMETIMQRLGRERSDKPQQIRIAPLLVQRASTRHLPDTR